MEYKDVSLCKCSDRNLGCGKLCTIKEENGYRKLQGNKTSEQEIIKSASLLCNFVSKISCQDDYPI
jgi:hypothetical protein